MEREGVRRVLEAILVSAKRKIKLGTLKKFFEGIDVEKLIEETNQRYQDFGFFIYRDKDGVELVTRPELSKYLINFFGFEENETLQEFLEILAIVAYGGPIKLQEINKLRGKNSAKLLRELLSEGLIKKENKFFYEVSEKFLRFLGFKGIKELPDYDKLRKKIRKSIE